MISSLESTTQSRIDKRKIKVKKNREGGGHALASP